MPIEPLDGSESEETLVICVITVYTATIATARKTLHFWNGVWSTHYFHKTILPWINPIIRKLYTCFTLETQPHLPSSSLWGSFKGSDIFREAYLKKLKQRLQLPPAYKKKWDVRVPVRAKHEENSERVLLCSCFFLRSLSLLSRSPTWSNSAPSWPKHWFIMQPDFF